MMLTHNVHSGTQLYLKKQTHSYCNCNYHITSSVPTVTVWCLLFWQQVVEEYR